ncbi:outer membrane protein OmpA-like peptidoglycan-associated protein [Spinactinospora alkalitolerans]|uniref:Outer membrane protein OmpA-like peptidoglycan-associated protein n=1 Tax=Spinactinospora alkalitolerans TaxID=687207 RepID=A0A852U520_9ACTN|nr:OmpA family protein [Spinactinospora alkalitolerans]NYE50645.1 outer membrane protein OmpA-like peptidoglycan-associated protein [Spinactinospora alkalitolerans]
MARTTPISVIALLASGSLLLSGCGITDDPGPWAQWFGEEGPPPVEEEFPYTKEGRIFQDTGQDATMRFSITGLERTPDHTVMYYEVEYLDEFAGSNRNLSMAHTLVDPITGRVYRQYHDDEGLKYGSVSPGPPGLYPVHDGVANEYRRYFPPIPEEVRQVTFIGSGLGAMTGIPIQDVDEERPDPEDPNGADHLSPSDPPPAGRDLTFENRRPDDGAAAGEGWVESFVDSEIASITRDGDTETISLHSDVMFEFDESDLTDEADEVVRQAAETLARNVDPDNPEITVIGHTDGVGGDAYNERLSVRRAETVRDLLAEEIGSGHTFVVEGRGSTEPVAREGGPDDEQARSRNRRVEFAYGLGGAAEPEEESDDGGLGVAERTVGWPAPFTDDSGDVVAEAERDGVRLEVYPLRRDGSYVIGSVALTNTSDEPVDPDMGGLDSLQQGGPERFSKGTLGGFQLLEPETGLVRYVAQMNFGGGTYSGFAEEVHELQPGNTYELVAVFPAPPADVEELTLRAGPFGELPEIPVGA